MDDARIWTFEESLWTATPEHYRESIDNECLMVVPTPPCVMSGEEAVAAVSATPRWTDVSFTERRVARPQEGLIVIAYQVRASKDGEEAYEAHCTSTYRRRGHEDWTVVQHQQTPPITATAKL